MASDEIITNETLSGRIYRQPRQLTINSDGRLRIPEGTTVDFRPATVIFGDGFADNLFVGNVTQTVFGNTNNSGEAPSIILAGSNNTIQAGANNTIIGSVNSTIEGNEHNVILASDSATIGTDASFSVIETCKSCLVTGFCEGVTLRGSRNSYIDETWTGPPIVQFPGETKIEGYSMITNSDNCYMQGVVINSDINNSLFSYMQVNLPVSGGIANHLAQCRIDQSSQCFQRGGILAGSAINRCYQCRVTSAEGLNANSDWVVYSSITNCYNCRIQRALGASNVIHFCSINDSSSSNITDRAQWSNITAGNNCNMSGNCTFCFATGSNCNLVGRTGVFNWNGGSVTANNQCVLNGQVEVQTGNLNVTQGYIRTENGVLRNTLTTSNAALYTVTTADITVILDPAVTQVSTTSPASYGSAFPLNTTVEYTIHVPAANVKRILTATTTGFRRITNYLERPIPRSGGIIKLYFINTTVSPHFDFETIDTAVSTSVTTTDDRFGVAPPKSDANQLPVSASRAAHEALTTTSYVDFNAIYTDWQSTINTAYSCFRNVAATGVYILVPGTYTFHYEFYVATVSGGGEYRVRSDLAIGAAPLAFSYAEVQARNDDQGPKRQVHSTPPVYIPGGSTVSLRLSQDSVYVISATAHIRDVSLRIEGHI